MRVIEYLHVLKPSVEYLEKCGVLLLNTPQMAEFLSIPHKTVQQLASTDRIPRPMKLGFGSGLRWNIFELLEWVEAGCPRRRQWHAIRENRGRYPAWQMRSW
jgi:predicted DNA-binding transcriptional regulator AlpA